ncbi:MAG: amidohydrolase family protein, partial [Eubacteriales bacterium]|nr:amidohydrolase family protein [Eubacteriales bacterium]
MKDKIFYNGNIITMTGENDTVEAVLIRNGKIEKTGSLSDVKGCSSQAELVNLDGKTLMPSFVDGHSHFASIGKMEKTTVDLMDCKNFDEIVERIKAFIKKYNIPEGKVVSGRGYDHNELEEKTSPTKEILDMASSKHPIIVSHVSGHIGCVNTLALKLKGITRETQYKEGGVICHDEQGEVTGVLEEGAFFDMRALAEKPSKEEEKELILAGQEVYAKYGITTVQNGGAYAADTKLLTELAQEDKYKLDVVSYMMFAVTSKEEMEKYKEYQGKYVNHFKIGGYKLFMDGSPQCKTAWLSRPYEGEKEYCGYPILTDEQALSYIQRAIDENQQLLVHCNGDQASEQF